MMYKIKSILMMTKPKQLLLLMITMYGAYFTASGKIDLIKLILLTIVGIGSAGGVTALNMYLESDVDAVMKRTSDRPLPRGELTPTEALFGITILIVIGIIAGSLINNYVALTALTGLYFDIIAYTEVAKRHTEWALLFGSVAGCMPALGGWAAGKGAITPLGLILAGIVYVWQPLHVAFIHYYYEDDYERAGIPTIPSKLGYEAFANLATFSIASSIILTWTAILIIGHGFLTGTIATLLGIEGLLSVRGFREKPSKDMAKRMIKFASPLVGVVFVFLPIELVLLNSII